MSTYSCRDKTLRENYPHSIIERNNNGAIVGVYRGYYKPRSGIVALYPDYRHPATYGKVLTKKKISDVLVKCGGD